MDHRWSRHQELPVRPGMASSLIEERWPIGDIFHPHFRNQLERRADSMERPVMAGPISSFYLSAFVKKFTYAGLIYLPFSSADILINALTRQPAGAERNNHSGPADGGETPLTIAHGGQDIRHNVDGRGLVFRRRRALPAAMPARLEPDRPDPQLPIEEELYG